MGAAAEGFGGEKEDGVEAIEWARREDLPRRVLQEAFDGVTKDESIAGGGSTACVAVVDWWGRLRVAKYVFPFFLKEDGRRHRSFVGDTVS